MDGTIQNACEGWEPECWRHLAAGRRRLPHLVGGVLVGQDEDRQGQAVLLKLFRLSHYKWNAFGALINRLEAGTEGEIDGDD
jgi:hypothetical protein